MGLATGVGGTSARLIRFPLVVDGSKVMEMYRAVHAERILGSAIEDGATQIADDSTPIVPTFTAVAWHYHDRVGLYRRLGIDPEIALHGENEWWYHGDLRLGDRLTATVSLLSDATRRGRRAGEMRAVELLTEYHRHSEIVIAERTLLLQPSVALTSPEAASAPRADGGAIPDVRPLASDDNSDEVGPLTRTDFVRYAGASGDLSAVHHDEPLAQRVGLASVFAMGMLPAGIAGVHALRLAGDRGLSGLKIRMTDRVWPGETLTLHEAGSSVDPAGVTTLLTEVRVQERVVIRAEATVGRAPG